jgi:hypothetical protein
MNTPYHIKKPVHRHQTCKLHTVLALILHKDPTNSTRPRSHLRQAPNITCAHSQSEYSSIHYSSSQLHDQQHSPLSRCQ